MSDRCVVWLALACVAMASSRSAPAAELVYFAELSGTAAAPPNGSLGFGAVVVVIDTSSAHLHLDVAFGGLSGVVQSAHIEGLTSLPGQGVAASVTSLPTLSGFASGVVSGFYHGVLDLQFEPTYNPAFIAMHGDVTQSRHALEEGLNVGRAYFSIRTSAYPDGEIRGFLAPSPPSDFDRNGRVDGQDLSMWRFGFQASNWGDADKDADTDGHDFLIWQRELGSQAQLPGQQPAGAAHSPIPEPAAFPFAVVAASTIAAWRRHGRPPFVAAIESGRAATPLK